MSIPEFVNLWTNQTVSFPNCDDNQCITLVHRYGSEVLNLQDPSFLAQAQAGQIWTNFPNVPGHQYFTQIANTPDNVPVPGDLVIWGQNGTVGIPDGHIAIFLSGDVNSFISFDANWPLGSKPHQQAHGYTDVLGWLHPSGNLIVQQAVELDSQDIAKLTSQLTAQMQATDSCQAQLKSAAEQAMQLQAQLGQLQLEILSLTTERDDLKTKYTAEQQEVVNANEALTKLASTNKDYASQTISAEHANGDLTEYLKAIADTAHVAPAGSTKDLVEEVLAEMQRLQKAEKQLPKLPSLGNVKTYVAGAVRPARAGGGFFFRLKSWVWTNP